VSVFVTLALIVGMLVGPVLSLLIQSKKRHKPAL
jgi:hypothetical protein